MQKTIYMTRPIHEVGMTMLRDKGYEIITGPQGETPTHESVVHALSSRPYDAVVTFLTDTVDASLFTACPSAKLFANYSVGFNNVVIEDAKSHGVFVTNTPGSAGKAVAEHTVALILAVTARIAEGDAYMRAGKYTGWQPDLLLGTDLTGKTIGLIGLGDIGSQVARMLAKGFSCPIVYSDMKANEELDRDIWSRRLTQEEVLRTADIISLHVPLLPSTMHLINDETIAIMKDGAIIINTARGPVVDEQALVRALKSKKLRGAGLDVFEFEPHPAEGLLDMENVVLTPHIASARESVRIRMSEIVACNIISFFETGAVNNSVVH
jgi:glyoxylate reductase